MRYSNIFKEKGEKKYQLSRKNVMEGENTGGGANVGGRHGNSLNKRQWEDKNKSLKKKLTVQYIRISRKYI